MTTGQDNWLGDKIRSPKTSLTSIFCFAYSMRVQKNLEMNSSFEWYLVLVPDPNQPQSGSLSVSCALYWKRYTRRMKSGDETKWYLEHEVLLTAEGLVK